MASTQPRIFSGDEKKRKPPACDTCKARRVLCHPQPNGTPCPRCAEKGVLCTTTPVVRGRQARKHLDVVASHTISVYDSTESTASSGSNTLFEAPDTISTRNLPFSLELSPEIVVHLFECFAQLPQFSHPLVDAPALRDALQSTSWKINFLPLQVRVLAYCVIALASSISYDRTVLGPGPQPASFADPAVFYRGADLRGYGTRRAPMSRALYAEAFRLACEAAIFLEVSENNAASCFILQFLERGQKTNSRPWATAYVSHVRTLAATWDEADVNSRRAIGWAGYLMIEALAGVAQGKPVLITHNDQLLISGNEPPSLQELFESLQASLHASPHPAPNIRLRMLQPFLFHVTRLARQLSDTITGDYARRNPLSETAIIDVLSSLTLLHSICSVLFNNRNDNPQTEADPIYFFADPHAPLTQDMELHACEHLVTFGRATLVLTLHRELVLRVPPSMDAISTQWVHERLALLRDQAREQVGFAAVEVADALRRLPSLPHLTHLERDIVLDYAQFCLDEADANPHASDPERVDVLQTLVDALKLMGYSWEVPLGLVERMEVHVATHRDGAPSSDRLQPYVHSDMFLALLEGPWMAAFPTYDHSQGT
ncbi:hypothetical protein B0H10DRAFT_2083516 [Mycena sp. CBHHK59/15]|nr:hypothetical protein B0H10DRAFT_2083516 [Mycena sp. CBHHK59/15]